MNQIRNKWNLMYTASHCAVNVNVKSKSKRFPHLGFGNIVIPSIFAISLGYIVVRSISPTASAPRCIEFERKPLEPYSWSRYARPPVVTEDQINIQQSFIGPGVTFAPWPGIYFAATHLGFCEEIGRRWWQKVSTQPKTGVIEGNLEVKLPTIWTVGKAEVGRVKEKKRDQRRERVRRKSEKKEVGKSRFIVFFPMIWGSGGSKSRLAKVWPNER